MPRNVPLTYRLPVIVDVAPGVLSVMMPLLSIVKTEVVAKPEVVVEMLNIGLVSPAWPAIEKSAQGVVVPMPTLPVSVMTSSQPVALVPNLARYFSPLPTDVSPAFTSIIEKPCVPLVLNDWPIFNTVVKPLVILCIKFVPIFMNVPLIACESPPYFM